MKKPESLRKALIAAVPTLKRNPDKLLIFIESGTIACTGAPSLSFEYRFALNAIVTDFAGSADQIIVPTLAWIRDNQPELMLNPDHMKDGIKFEAEILNSTTLDLSIKLLLTERVGVNEAGGKTTITHFDEPALPDLGGPMISAFLAGGEAL